MDETEIPKESIAVTESVSENLDNFKKPILFTKVKKQLPTPKENQIITEEKDPSADSPIEQKNEVLSSTEPVIQLKYIEPTWSGFPVTTSDKYKFEVLKSGMIIETLDLMSKKFWVFGRLPNCDFYLAHPTVSRHHAVLQFNANETEERAIGFYLYDLGSTHGTFLNKNRIKSHLYVRVQVGHMIKFGNSTRNYILQGPEEDAEAETELTVTELKQKRLEEMMLKEKEKKIAENLAKLEKEKAEELERERGIDWGMGEDADEETDLTENPYAATNNEELYLDDPKKTLRGFFEREGCDLEYNVEERGIGQFSCRVELPIENSLGKPIVAEATVKGKKKEAVVQCALEACRLLDRAGVLRQAKQESRKRKSKKWEDDDFYGSDDDEFLDRTGAVQRKRERRMKMFGRVKEDQVETYSSLMEKDKILTEQIVKIQHELDAATQRLQEAENNEESNDVDALDAFMNDLIEAKPDKLTIRRLTSDLVKLKQEHDNLKKLISIAKPVTLPPLVASEHTQGTKLNSAKNKLPIIGKRLKMKPLLESKPVSVFKQPHCSKDNDSGEEFDDIESLKGVGKNENNETEKTKTSEMNRPSRVIGPEMPKDMETITMEVNTDLNTRSENKSTKTRIRNENKSYKKKERLKNSYGNVENDADYSMWLPPEDQKGDGKTKLNEKLGY